MRGRMERFRTGRRNPRATRVAFGVVATVAAMLLAACSSSSSSSTPAASSAPAASAAPASSAGGSTAASTPASAGASSGGSSPNIAALNADVNKYAGLPSFSDYGSNYGGKIPSVANLA